MKKLILTLLIGISVFSTTYSQNNLVNPGVEMIEYDVVNSGVVSEVAVINMQNMLEKHVSVENYSDFYRSLETGYYIIAYRNDKTGEWKKNKVYKQN